MAHRILMCSPQYYHAPGALRQWERFIELLRIAADVHIELVDPAPQAPDLVFTANAALVNGDLAIIATPADPAQTIARKVYRGTLARLGFATTFIDGASFAGTADALFDRVRPITYVGYGPHSDRIVTLQLGEFVAARVVPLGLAGPHFAHLDSVLCPLGSGHILVYMPALNPHAQRLLHRTIEPEYLIEISSADAMHYACNAVELDDALIMHHASRGLRDRLLAAGYRVFSTDLGEFIKRGAGAKRLTLRLDDGPAAAGAAA